MDSHTTPPTAMFPYRLLAIDIQGCYSVGILQASSDDQAIEKTKVHANCYRLSSFALYNRMGVTMLVHIDPKDKPTFSEFIATAEGQRLH